MYLSYESGAPIDAGAQDCAYVVLPVNASQRLRVQTYLGRHTAICQYKDESTSSYIGGSSIYYLDERNPTFHVEEFDIIPGCKYVGISTFKKTEPIAVEDVDVQKTYGSMKYLYGKIDEVLGCIEQCNDIADEILS